MFKADSDLKVGYLVHFMVLKGLPDYDSYLVILIDKGIIVKLPKKYALKQYKTGETGWASIFEIKGARVVLSQKSPQYVRKILEYLLSSLIQEEKIKFKRVAKVNNSHFYKVAIESLNGASEKEIAQLCVPYLKDKAKDYIKEKVILIKYSKDMKEYIMNSLAPAPREHIQKVIYFKSLKEVIVYVEDKYVGLFLGSKGQNVSTASKLTGVNIILTAGWQDIPDYPVFRHLQI